MKTTENVRTSGFRADILIHASPEHEPPNYDVLYVDPRVKTKVDADCLRALPQGISCHPQCDLKVHGVLYRPVFTYLRS
jgi:hypothetical protein